MIKRHARNSKSISTARSRDRLADGAIFFFLLFVLAVAVILGGCSFTDVNNEETTPEPVVLVDQTGMEWDITTAIWKYGFEVARFEFGLGPRAIQPILEPEMLSPGDRNYPANDATFPVIGVVINGDVRAYGKFDIIQNEVVDDNIGGTPVAVAY